MGSILISTFTAFAVAFAHCRSLCIVFGLLAYIAVCFRGLNAGFCGKLVLHPFFRLAYLFRARSSGRVVVFGVASTLVVPDGSGDFGGLVIHELFHGLGFGSSGWLDTFDPNGKRRSVIQQLKARHRVRPSSRSRPLLPRFLFGLARWVVRSHVFAPRGSPRPLGHTWSGKWSGFVGNQLGAVKCRLRVLGMESVIRIVGAFAFDRGGGESIRFDN